MQLKDISKELICSVLMAVAIIAVGFGIPKDASSLLELIIKIFVGGAAYLFASYIIRPSGYIYCMEKLRLLMKKHNSFGG